MATSEKDEDPRAVAAARCYEIHASLGSTEVPEFEDLIVLGMAVKLALHIRGLPLIDYEILKLVASALLDIPRVAVERVVRLLAEVEFVVIQQSGSSIRGVLPTIPYYERLYSGLGEYLETDCRLTEAEQLSLALSERLSGAPESKSKVFNALGAEKSLFDRNLEIGKRGGFLLERRARGRDILINPNYFAENADIFADHVAGAGSDSVKRVLSALREAQGWPLGLIRKDARVGSVSLDPTQAALIERLAQEGMVKPPSIHTSHAGENHFIFTPSPGAAKLTPLKRDIYERAMAIVAAIRQGQLLPRRYRIRSPGAVLYKLRRDHSLSKATTEAGQQYRNLVHLRIGRLVDVGGGFSEFHIIDTEENVQALDMAYSLVSSGNVEGYEVDEHARRAMQEDQKYVESLVAGGEMRKRDKIDLPEETSQELELLLLRGAGEC